VLTDVFVGIGTAKIGDGIGVYASASATLEGNTIATSGRFGIVMDAPGAGTSIGANTVDAGIILQNQASMPMVDASLAAAVVVKKAADVVAVDSAPLGVPVASAPKASP
jgi:hypothetical protein